MVSMHPRVFGNWAFLMDGPGATIHSCIGYEAWTAVVQNCRFLYYKWQPMRVGCLILPYLVIIDIGCSPHGFPHSLDTKEMSEYVTRHFAWD